MFNYSYEDSVSKIIIVAIVNLAFGLILGFLNFVINNAKASIVYLLSSWVLILICIYHLFGDTPIKQAWLISLFLLIGGFLFTFFIRPKSSNSVGENA
jgi:MFS-type transporter involved in bile tolerance (Atg22 family)